MSTLQTQLPEVLEAAAAHGYCLSSRQLAAILSGHPVDYNETRELMSKIARLLVDMERGSRGGIARSARSTRERACWTVVGWEHDTESLDWDGVGECPFHPLIGPI